jgi:peptide deformylase
MTLLDIIHVPDPVLRRKAHKVTDFGTDFQALVNNMIETMREAPGVGLAAPQVAVSQRLVVVEYGDDEDDKAPKKTLCDCQPGNNRKNQLRWFLVWKPVSQYPSLPEK